MSNPQPSQSLLGSRGASSAESKLNLQARLTFRFDAATATLQLRVYLRLQFGRQSFSRFTLPNYRCAVGSEWLSDVIDDVVQPVWPRRRQTG